MDRYDSHLCTLSGTWHRLPISHLSGSIQYAFQPLFSGYKFSRAAECVAVARHCKNHTKRRIEWAKLRSLFRANHLLRQNASIRLLITSHMVMRPLLGSGAALLTLFCELGQLTTVLWTSPSSCSSGLKSDFFCSADKMLLHQPAIDVRILNRYKNKIRLIKENWTHRIERSHYVTLPRLQNFWISTNRGPANMAEKYEKINTYDFLVYDCTQEQNGSPYFSSILRQYKCVSRSHPPYKDC